ncbi:MULTISPECIES: MFS transporter [Streptococcus]|uniref:Heme/copper-type cytochrome/quinol oxidase subunit 1 n=1 Tax=Streptococcus viridans TaxID=78535 RepID=A0A3S5DZ13_9STRE|nr:MULTISPECIES: MFS transporter [Streptococcus]VED66350.1 heme/copper-type cytochrome/quinol oxidase subunit 1 [Streptococcus viridans]VEE18794.1 heme/copper-type cytochrome/quinol oxidase subunit 1 [Streptococcus australis]
MSEKEKESHKLGLRVGSNFQDTQELRKVLEQSISREEEVLTASQPVESEQDLEESQVDGEGAETEASTETLSRLSRSGHHRKEKVEARPKDQEDIEETLEDQEEKSLGRYAIKRPVPLSLPIAFSVLLGMVHVALPFINLLATNQQTQDLYAGWAISQGQVPYGHFFGVNGLLYYGLSGLGSLVGGQVLLVVFQILAYFFAGTSLYRMVRSLVASEKIAGQVQLLFYLLAGVLGFGGNYAVFYALPFLFSSMNFILAYLEDEKTDESFVAYGAGACLAFMIVPWLSVIFYLLAFLGLTAYHVKQKKLAHGFYQFLAALLGFSLLFYPLGYITVWNGSFGYAIHQTLYSLRSLQFDAGHLFANLVYYCLLLLTLGFASAFVMSFRKVSTSGQRVIRFMSWFGLLLVVAVVVGTPEQGAYQFLSLLPFGLPLLALWFAGDESTYQRRKMKNNSIWDLYFSSQAFLPILAMAYLVGYPVVNQLVLQNNRTSDRSAIAQYIKSHSDSKDTIYAWDQTAHLYQESGRLAASALLTPTAYMGPRENRTNLINQIKQAKPKFIVVNKDLDVTSAMQKVLTKNYEKVNQKGSQYTLYQCK